MMDVKAVSRTVLPSRDPSPAPGGALARLANARSLEDLIAGIRRHHHGFDAAGISKLAIVGAGPEGRRLCEICKARGITIAALADDDTGKLGMVLSSAKVEPSHKLAELDRTTPIVIASHRVLAATQRLRTLGFSTVLPFAALQVLAPEVFRPHMFYDGWLQDLLDNKTHYSRLNIELGDDRSRQVLDAVIGYRLTADPIALAPVMEQGRFHQGLYHPTGLFELGDNEVYVDAGAYDGDSIRWFKDRVADRYERIIAFEPDPRTYTKLKENFAFDNRVEAINAGLHRRKAVLRFRDDASRGAIFTEEGETSIDVVSLDEVLAGKRASYIKMNIEGAEIDAVSGARNTIQRWMPKLAISVYHRPSDLWRIPQLVRELGPNYDLYLRQHDGGTIETVLYAIVRQNGPRKDADVRD
jgi:FkbM family methyltransferase